LGFAARPLPEVVRFSADTFAYFTADPNLHVWGSIARAWPKAEGALFPGLTIAVLALTAIVQVDRPVFVAPFLLVLLPLFGVRLPLIKIASAGRTMIAAAFLSAVIVFAFRGQRRALRAWLASPVGFFAVVVVFAAAMSLGPEVLARGRVVADGALYAF